MHHRATVTKARKRIILLHGQNKNTLLFAQKVWIKAKKLTSGKNLSSVISQPRTYQTLHSNEEGEIGSNTETAGLKPSCENFRSD